MSESPAQSRHKLNLEPLIPASQSLPEITFRVIILSLILTVFLTAANAYLGLKVGLTISASIPAAVMAMAILRLFKNSNVLEVNIVQTTTSAGSALASGIIFSIPALILMHYWQSFLYWETVLIACAGGFLGVLFSIPLRRVLLNDPNLHFPEGTAVGNVLRASVKKSNDVSYLLWGGSVGAFISFAQTGLKVIAESAAVWFKAGSTVVGFGLGFAPALIGAGYIIGPVICASILFGALLCWLVFVPVLGLIVGLPDTGMPHEWAYYIWSTEKGRFIGVGVLLAGGISIVFSLVKPMVSGVKASLNALKQVSGPAVQVPRTDRDVSITFVFFGTLLLVLPIYFILDHALTDQFMMASDPLYLRTIALTVCYALLASFVFSCICGYMVGLVGSSSSPISAMTLSAVLIISLLLFFILGGHTLLGEKATAAAAFAIAIGAVVACASAIANDTMQDLKAGQIVGATPWKQQVMLLFGVAAAALITPPVLNLLLNAYGLGDVLPHPDMDPTHVLSAPQAQVLTSIATGVFSQNIPWALLSTGLILGFSAVAFNALFKSKGWHLSPIAIGTGIYLPIGTCMSLVVGGIIAYCLMRNVRRREKAGESAEVLDKVEHKGMLLNSGMVAGAALMGVFLAIPFSIYQNPNVLAIVGDGFMNTSEVIGLIVAIGLARWVYTKCNSD